MPLARSATRFLDARRVRCGSTRHGHLEALKRLPLRGVNVGLTKLLVSRIPLAPSGTQAIRRSWLHLSVRGSSVVRPRVGVASSSSSGQRQLLKSDARRLKYRKWNVWPVVLLVVSMVVRGSVLRHNVTLVLVFMRVRAGRTWSVSSCHGFVGQAQRMFAELRHTVHVSLCVLARQSACACEATPEIAGALLSRHSVALRPNHVGVGSRCASGACPPRVYSAKFVEKHSHNITVALSSAGI